ncbi:unnamed protein product [Prunus brigantina]
MGSRAAREASSIQWKYHIFLSFRGEDTRNGFTSHLHKALESRGYDVFMDEDDLQVGQVIKPELLQAIEKSKISVIVLSTRYADSSWCLDELVKIMECRRTLNQIVLPIFYKVDPSDVRKQTGTLESDFKKHTIRHKDDVVKEWRKALTEAANLCAGVLEDRNEAKFIEAFIENNIVGRLSTTPLPVAAYPVGVHSRVHDMISYLGGRSQDVVMIGIWGMGGLGKTTAAKAIYNRIKDKFEAHGFLGDIRDTANRHGLVYLQKLLLAEINKKPTKFHISCVDGGMGMIKKELGRKRVLVIIDDVDEKEQLEAIVGNRDWFGSGSRIIITTRDEHFLDVLHVNKTFTVPEMNPDEGLELFCRHAFQKGYPNEQYLELSEKVVSYSGGLPLALKVLGSFLIGRSIAEWESQLQELDGIPPEGILKKLRISYDGLDRDEKCIFLDISCFFIGMSKDHVGKILDGCGFKAEIKISVLLQRCLVTVNEKNQLMMHNLLRDMGRAISQEGDKEDRCRLWLREDVTDVLEDKSGTEEIEGVASYVVRYPHLCRSLDPHLFRDLHFQDFGPDLTRFSPQAFTNMKKLRLLNLSNAELTGEYKDFPKKLIWLCWHRCPLESIPDDFPMQPKLVALDLQWSKLKIVWKDCKLHQNLKILNLSHSYKLTKSPDISKLPNLEELILEGCVSLSEVHSSIGYLGRLSLVNLHGCEMLRDLPLNFYNSKSIETLILNKCRRFVKLAEGLGDMLSLTTLKADETAIRQIPSSILKLKRLKALSLCYVRKKRSPSINLLPPSLQSLSSLRELALANCSLTDDAVPKDLGSLISLERLDLARNDFCSLPSLSRLSQLQDLSLHDCINLRAIPDLPTNLKVLKANGCFELEKMPDFSEMSNIRELHLRDSGKLIEIPGLDKSLNFMTTISMDGCTNLTADFRKNILQGWTSCGYGGIFLSGYDIPDWFHCVHEDNIVYFTVPQSVGRILKGLTLSFVYSLGFYGCRISIKNMTKGTELEARIIPVSNYQGYYLWQGQLSNDELKLKDGDKVLIELTDDRVKVKKTGVSLVWDKFMNENIIDYHLCAYERRQSQNLVDDDDIIHVEYDYHIRKSPDFSKFPNLEKLILKGCKELIKVHSYIGDLGRLSLVDLEGCQMLKDLPLNFYKSKSIETLILNGCGMLNLADGLGDMVSLTILKADNTHIRQIPSSIVKLKKLRILSLSGCWRLTEDAIPKDLCSLISLEDLLLGGNNFDSLPSLVGLSKLKVLCLNACSRLRAIPDLPTNLYVLKANDCPELETIPDFSEMSNIRELYLRDSGKLTEIPGLDKSLNSMTRIHMEKCTNLTADFRKNILQGWTSCGYGGIFLNGKGNDIPDWFHYVHDDDIVYFTVPQSVGRILKGLTLSFGFSSSSERVFFCCFRISIENMTGVTELDARIIPHCPYGTVIPHCPYGTGYYLWQGQLSNDELKLQDGDKVWIEIIIVENESSGWAYVKVKKTGVSLVWDKFMNENMIDYHLCAYEQRPSQNLVNDDDIIHVEDDHDMTKSPDFSKFPYLEKLILKGCKRLNKVHSYIGDLGRLSLVNLEGCKSLEDLPLNFYKSKSIETLILNGCSGFQNLADGLGDMVSLTILKADNTAIRQIPSSIVKLKKLRILSLSGCRLTEDAIPKDLCGLISLEHLLLGGNYFRSLPRLAGLSKLKVLCVNACGFLRAIPDLPTNLYVLKANGCSELETIPDFSKMWNMRELYLCDSVKLTEVPGLDKSLNSMTRIHMEGCTNLTADFRNNILQHPTGLDNPDPHLYDLETNPDFSGGDDDSISRNRENKGRKSKRRRIGSFDYV